MFRSCAELDHKCSRQLLAVREGAAISWSNAIRKLCGANGGPCRAEPSADIAANRTRIGTTRPTRAGRTGGGASDAARSFEKPVSWWRSDACRAARVRKLDATKAKRATKRELLVVATIISQMVGTPVFSDRTEFSVTTAAGQGLRHFRDFCKSATTTPGPVLSTLLTSITSGRRKSASFSASCCGICAAR